jgi:hypothetical protein
MQGRQCLVGFLAAQKEITPIAKLVSHPFQIIKDNYKTKNAQL